MLGFKVHLVHNTAQISCFFLELLKNCCRICDIQLGNIDYESESFFFFVGQWPDLNLSPRVSGSRSL